MFWRICNLPKHSLSLFRRICNPTVYNCGFAIRKQHCLNIYISALSGLQILIVYFGRLQIRRNTQNNSRESLRRTGGGLQIRRNTVFPYLPSHEKIPCAAAAHGISVSITYCLFRLFLQHLDGSSVSLAHDVDAFLHLVQLAAAKVVDGFCAILDSCCGTVDA